MEFLMSSDRSVLTRFFLGIWHVIDGTRKLALNLVFLLIVYFVFLAVMDTTDTVIIKQDTALVLRPYGNIVEQYSGTPGQGVAAGHRAGTLGNPAAGYRGSHQTCA